jgi:hypothetical protein
MLLICCWAVANACSGLVWLLSAALSWVCRTSEIWVHGVHRTRLDHVEHRLLLPVVGRLAVELLGVGRLHRRRVAGADGALDLHLGRDQVLDELPGRVRRLGLGVDHQVVAAQGRHRRARRRGEGDPARLALDRRAHLLRELEPAPSPSPTGLVPFPWSWSSTGSSLRIAIG